MGSAILVLAVTTALRTRSPAPTFAPEVGPTVYRPVRRAPIAAPPDGRIALSVLAGQLRDASTRTAALEATMRLHLWLALRDVHPTGPVLDWSPASPFGASREQVSASRCAPGEPDIGAPLGRDDPPLLGTPLRPRKTLRVYLDVGAESQDVSIEVRVCPPGSRGTTQVFGGPTGSEGPILREILTWLSPHLELDEVEDWFDAWSRPLAPDLGVLRAYGSTLVESMAGSTPPQLLEAARLLPEAGWLAAALAPRGPDRRALLEQACSLRPGFTAALEDLAWSWVEEDRADLARLTLERLRSEGGTRPSGLLLAARVLDHGLPAAALALLEDLPPAWSSTTAARRLEARAQIERGDPVAGRGAAAAWALADPAAAEAWLLQGDALVQLDEPVGARHAYGQGLAHPSQLRAEALERWAVLLLSVPDPAPVLERLESDVDAALVEQDPALLELRAWARWLLGDARGAHADTRLLIELDPTTPRHRRNACVFGLTSGSTDAHPDACGGAAFDDLFGSVMDAVWLSRRPFRSPDEGGLLDRAIEHAVALGPLDPAASGAAVRVLGPRAEEDEQDALQAQFRVSVGAISP